MPRKLIVRKDEIYLRRASAWESHYSNRGAARAMLENGFNARVLIDALKHDLPAPLLDVDGRQLCLTLAQRVKRAELARRFRLAGDDLLCVWYWSADGWMDFVRAFQALPDVQEDFYYTYELSTDRSWLVPVSTARRGRRAVVKPVDNKSTTLQTKVQPRQISRTFEHVQKSVGN